MIKIKRPKLSCVLIVKNEEELLPGCLDSIKPIWDELVIVDTGSTDHTPAIAKAYDAELGYFDWCDDMSAARNYAETLCHSDYIYWQDADERLLEGHDAIRQIVEEGKLDGIAPLMRFSAADTYFRQELLHKNLPVWKWKGAVHEWLAGPCRTERRDIVVTQVGRSSGDRANVKDIFEALRSNFQHREFTERHLFYLAREHLYKGHLWECIGLVLVLLGTPVTWPLQRSRAAIVAGDCYNTLGDENAAREMYLRAIDEYAEWAEPYFALGEQARLQGRYVEAIGWLLASTGFDPGGFYYDQTIYQWRRYDSLAVSYYELHHYKEALHWGQLALGGNPGEKRLGDNLKWYMDALEQEVAVP